MTPVMKDDAVLTQAFGYVLERPAKRRELFLHAITRIPA